MTTNSAQRYNTISNRELKDQSASRNSSKNKQSIPSKRSSRIMRMTKQTQRGARVITLLISLMLFFDIDWEWWIYENNQRRRCWWFYSKSTETTSTSTIWSDNEAPTISN